MSRLKIDWKQMWADFLGSAVPSQFQSQRDSFPSPPLSSNYIVDEEQVAPFSPLYFVAHPDGDFSVANPQPTLITIHQFTLNALIEAEKQVADMAYSVRSAKFERDQLKWLLSIAPVIEVPRAREEARLLLRSAQAPFTYVHPKTLARVEGHAAISLAQKRTTIIPTSLMPEERIIFSYLPLPGTEKRHKAVTDAVGGRASRKQKS